MILWILSRLLASLSSFPASAGGGVSTSTSQNDDSQASPRPMHQNDDDENYDDDTDLSSLSEASASDSDSNCATTQPSMCFCGRTSQKFCSGRLKKALIYLVFWFMKNMSA